MLRLNLNQVLCELNLQKKPLNTTKQKKLKYSLDRNTALQMLRSLEPQPYSDCDPLYVYNHLLTNAERRVFDAILLASQYHNNEVSLSQKFIAKYASVSYPHTRRCLVKLEQIGFIASVYVHFDIKYYKVSKWFYREGILDKLNCTIVTIRNEQLNILGDINIFKSNSISISNLDIKENRLSHNKSKKQRSENYTTMARGPFEVKMNNNGFWNGINPISERIQAIKVLDLNEHGQIELCPFADPSHDFAEKNYKPNPRQFSPIKVYIKLCLQWHRENQVEPMWSKRYALRDVYPAPKDGKYLKPKAPLIERKTDSSHKRTELDSKQLAVARWIQERDESLKAAIDNVRHFEGKLKRSTPEWKEYNQSQLATWMSRLNTLQKQTTMPSLNEIIKFEELELQKLKDCKVSQIYAENEKSLIGQKVNGSLEVSIMQREHKIKDLQILSQTVSDNLLHLQVKGGVDNSVIKEYIDYESDWYSDYDGKDEVSNDQVKELYN